MEQIEYGVDLVPRETKDYEEALERDFDDCLAKEGCSKENTKGNQEVAAEESS